MTGKNTEAGDGAQVAAGEDEIPPAMLYVDGVTFERYRRVAASMGFKPRGQGGKNLAAFLAVLLDEHESMAGAARG